MSYLGICPDTTTMTMDNTLYGGKPNPCSREFICLMQPIKGTEQHILVTHVETRTVVSNLDRLFPAVVFSGEPDGGLWCFNCKFPGVIEQVLHSHLE